MGERTAGNEQRMDLPSGSVFDAPSTTQKADLGRIVEFKDGRKFMSVKAGATLAAGNVVSQPAASALTANALAVAAIGATQLTLTIAAVTLNQYQDGTIHFTDDTGQGYTYKIKSNTATSGGTITIELYEPLIVAIDATTDCMLVPNLCNGVRAGIAAAKPLGIAIAAMSSGEYGWIQIAGVGTITVKTATSIAAGKSLMAGADAGVVIADGTLPEIGVALGAVDDNVAAYICLG
jgi:predicted RecA/RadA family phage recombinase